MTDAEANATRDARIASLETQLAELRQDLARATRPQIRSMRMTGRCPACNAGTLLHFRRIRELGPTGLIELALQKQFSVWGGIKLSAGTLEAYACRACRLVEWQAETLDGVVPDSEYVVAINTPDDPDFDAGPYR